MRWTKQKEAQFSDILRQALLNDAFTSLGLLSSDFLSPFVSCPLLSYFRLKTGLEQVD